MHILRRISPARPAAVLLLAAGALVVPGLTVPARAGAVAQPPVLTVERLLQTTPFRGSRSSMTDNEGSAYVAKDRALWMVDDEGQRIFAMNVRTGTLQRTIGKRTLERVRRFHGRTRAGKARSRDLESVAYDAARDRLYVFSGSDCWPSTRNCRVKARPTVFRLDRHKGRLRLHSFQALPSSHTNAAAWSSVDRRVYVGDSHLVRRYDYRHNRFGPPLDIAGVHDILGMDFAADGESLLVTHDETLLSSVPWPTRTLDGGWSVDLTPSEVRDARGVAVVGGRYLVSDGADDRATSSRYRYAVFVLGPAG